MSAFIDSLKPGDIVAATVNSSAKLHLVRMVRRVTPGMFRGDVNPEAAALYIDARPVCDVNPRYYWRPKEDLEKTPPADRCRWCFQRWRNALNREPIKGWKEPEAEIPRSEIKLPFGWVEVTPQSHPLDLADDADDPDPDEKEYKVGAKRTEIKRWIRGNRYVRLVRYSADKRIGVRYGKIDGKTEEDWGACTGSWEGVLPAAVTLMALGGSNMSRTNYNNLKMSDIALNAADDAAGE